MKKGIYIFFAAVMSLALTACGESTEKKDAKADKVAETPDYGTHKVEVYYFHGDRRCPGCNAIEDVAEMTINETFGDNEEVKYYAINFDREHNKDIAQKYDIAWSSLLIVSGERAIDITLEAFQYATSNPEKLQEEIISVVNEYLNS